MENLTNSYVEKELATLTRLYFLQAVTKYNLPLDTKIPKVVCDIKGNRLAGMAYCSPKEWKIRYNLAIAKKNWEAFKNRTVAHEVAHMICEKVYPYASAHGNEWKSIMRNLGHNPSRCHSYDTSEIAPARKTQKFMHQCGCGEHPVGKKIHQNILSGVKYRCNKCKSIIS